MGLLNTYKQIKGDNHVKEMVKKGQLAFLIKYARNQKGISQQKLADAIGTAKSTITRIENGQNIPNLNTIQQIAEKLDCIFSVSGKEFTLEIQDGSGSSFPKKIIEDKNNKKVVNSSLIYNFEKMKNNKSLFSKANEVSREFHYFIHTNPLKEIHSYEDTSKEANKIILEAI